MSRGYRFYVFRNGEIIGWSNTQEHAQLRAGKDGWAVFAGDRGQAQRRYKQGLFAIRANTAQADNDGWFIDGANPFRLWRGKGK
jgi:hypothetical protein